MYAFYPSLQHYNSKQSKQLKRWQEATFVLLCIIVCYVAFLYVCSLCVSDRLVGCETNIDVVSTVVEAYAVNDPNRAKCISTHLIMPSKKISCVYKCTLTTHITCTRKSKQNAIEPFKVSIC